jgi:formate dehydrogenase iron-sulfur subunit
MNVGILTDLTKCIGCQACVLACKKINELPDDEPVNKLSSSTRTIIEKRNGVNVRRHCMHCLDPACVSACPVSALEKIKEGPVIYDPNKCIGCRYCLLACPFEIPKYEWDLVLPKVQKCTMCYEKKITKGQEPACTSVCPTGATIFGERNELLDIAYHRIKENPKKYVDHIYGVNEAGGTSVLYLSDIPFDKLGFKQVLDKTTYPKLTWDILSKIPNIVSIGGVALLGTWWIINRRMTMDKIHRGELTEEDTFGSEINEEEKK